VETLHDIRNTICRVRNSLSGIAGLCQHAPCRVSNLPLRGWPAHAESERDCTSIEEATVTSYTERNSLSFLFYTDSIIIVKPKGLAA
jgi:hypothetical protein